MSTECARFGVGLPRGPGTSVSEPFSGVSGTHPLDLGHLGVLSVPGQWARRPPYNGPDGGSGSTMPHDEEGARSS